MPFLILNIRTVVWKFLGMWPLGYDNSVIFNIYKPSCVLKGHFFTALLKILYFINALLGISSIYFTMMIR